MKTLLILSAAGTLFSGYLSATKLLTDTCAFNEGCPYFLGYPACWYGFVMFTSILVLTLLAMYSKGQTKNYIKTITVISIVGIIFSGSFVLDEVTKWLSGQTYELLLPSCVYGLIFYATILVVSLKLSK
ncbi:MAG: hypothetical protein WC761_06615 [Candidatus Paceibacterota bacterium]|jgi:uncharacterized membrane protein